MEMQSEKSRNDPISHMMSEEVYSYLIFLVFQEKVKVMIKRVF